jgi:hypothetical protein
MQNYKDIASIGISFGLLAIGISVLVFLPSAVWTDVDGLVAVAIFILCYLFSSSRLDILDLKDEVRSLHIRLKKLEEGE